MELAKRTWFIRFIALDDYLREYTDSELSFTTHESAKEAFQIYDEPVSNELYYRIELIEYDWASRQETTLATWHTDYPQAPSIR